MSEESTEDLFNRTSQRWRRIEPVLLTDFTSQSFLLSWCEPIANLDVLDLGCGEGYVTRLLKRRGAATVVGLDSSAAMVNQAWNQEADDQLGIIYHQGDATDLSRFYDGSFDLIVAVFLLDYADRAQCRAILREVARVLRSGGQFVFAVPHPILPFTRVEPPCFYSVPPGTGYFSGRDQVFDGEISRRDGEGVPVRCVHKTFSDYFDLLRDAGFTRLPDVAELRVTEEIAAIDPDWFRPILDQPLHLALRAEIP